MRSSRELKQRSQSVLPLGTAAFRLTTEGQCQEGRRAGTFCSELPEVEAKLPSSPCNTSMRVLQQNQSTSSPSKEGGEASETSRLLNKQLCAPDTVKHLCRQVAHLDPYEWILTSPALTITSVNSGHNQTVVHQLQAGTAIAQHSFLTEDSQYSMQLFLYCLKNIISMTNCISVSYFLKDT